MILWTMEAYFWAKLAIEMEWSIWHSIKWARPCHFEIKAEFSDFSVNWLWALSDSTVMTTAQMSATQMNATQMSATQTSVTQMSDFLFNPPMICREKRVREVSQLMDKEFIGPSASQCDFWAILSSKQNSVNKYFSRQPNTANLAISASSMSVNKV